MSINFYTNLLTGSVRARVTPPTDHTTEEEGEIQPLLIDASEWNGLDDFIRHDPQDTIFEEYDSPFPSETPFEWRSRRSNIRKSVIDSAWLVLQLQFWGGILMGILSLIYCYVNINTSFLCHWAPYEHLPRLQMNVRVTAQAIQGFLLEMCPFLMWWTMFKWPLLRELNLLTVSLLIAFVDVTYRLFLHIYNAYKPPWVPYPLNALFSFLTLYSSYAVGKKIFPERKTKALELVFKLCIQFLMGVPIGYFFTYQGFSWFTRTEKDFKRLILAIASPVIIWPGKTIARLCASHLEGANHPGTSFAAVAVIYGASSIVCRILQAGIESFELFLALSVGHGVVYIAERLTVPLRDYYYKKIAFSYCRCCCCHCCHQRPQYNVRTPRSQRLIADMSIQGMLFESTAIVYSIGVFFVYYLVYGTSEHRMVAFRRETTQRILVALAVEFLFNAIAVLFQTRYMNIPVIRVWRRSWKRHLILHFIITVLSVVYFTGHMLELIRGEFEGEANFPLMSNCTNLKPFHLIWK